MKIRDLKGIGEKTAELFGKLSVFCVEDLIEFYPRDYDVFELPVAISELSEHTDKTAVAVYGIIAGRAEFRKAGNLQIFSVPMKDADGIVMTITWFNMPFLKNTIKQGYRFIFRGKVIFKNGGYVMEQPAIYSPAEYEKLTYEMQPIYALTKGLSNKIVKKAVAQALDTIDISAEHLPLWIRTKYALAEHEFSIRNIHFPKDMKSFTEARKRLVFEEFFMFIMSVRSMKENNAILPNNFVIRNCIETDGLINELPYELTGAQQKAWEEVKKDMSGNRLMNRLIQGDVGSGKTIIATLALMNAANAGYQGAMMVPTEVLARQQYESVCGLFEKHGIDIKVSLLTGAMSAREKRDVYEKIESGETSVIIGTHALIQEKVIYKDLGLVITDEQHRFGVNQREALSNKGRQPHIMVMSATPIPRTLAIIIYGDLDISVIDEMPAERLPIMNCLVDEGYRPKAYSFIANQISQGRQAYIICPMVEESETMEAENVVEYTQKIKKELPSGIRVGYLHGKMKNNDKNDIMNQFSNGSIDVLVSTTVVEVGVNVPNASVIMIENADRFGLAQLHQLRGRVGRGKHQSYCIFVSSSKSKKNRERLNIINSSNDGFKIAEEDMKLRGPGDFFGRRQSGMLEFAIGDIFTDAGILKDASEAADEIKSSDPELNFEDNALFANKLKKYTQKCINSLNL